MAIRCAQLSATIYKSCHRFLNAVHELPVTKLLRKCPEIYIGRFDCFSQGWRIRKGARRKEVDTLGKISTVQILSGLGCSHNWESVAYRPREYITVRARVETPSDLSLRNKDLRT